MPGNEDGAVALERILLGTHQGDAMLPHPVSNAINALSKQFGSSEPIVLNFAIDITFRVHTPSTEFSAQEDVNQADSRQRCLEVLAIELWICSAEWRRPDVAYRCHIVASQQCLEVWQRVR